MMEIKCTTTLLVAVLVVCFFCCSVPVTWAQSSAGFLNIDCGATTSYVDPVTGIQWEPDESYIPTGTNHQNFLPPTDPNFSPLTELKSLRAFTDLRAKKYCYQLPVTENTTYLLRASFFYGNYDNAAKPPSFQLSIETTTVENITTSSSGVVYKELLYVSQSNVTYLCLLRDGTESTPFVSAISLRPVREVYETFNMYLGEQKYMSIRTRINFGGSALVRYPDDSYDRYWYPEGAMSSYLKPTVTPIEVLGVATNITSEAFRPPSAVMQTAVTTTGNLTSYYMPPGSETYDSAFVLLHFAELDSTATNTSREFYVDVGTGSSPNFVNPYNDTGGAFIRTSWLYWDRVIEPTTLLTLYPDPLSLNGPILNALELYSVSNTRSVGTIDRDVFAIEAIKATMNLSEWTGDPCLPSPHPWVKCSTVDSVLIPPEVIAINLSSYNLTGSISPSFAKLLSLTTLSLDHNSLVGPFPDLSPLVLLTTLHLENNYLSGTLPDWLTSLPLRELSVQNDNFNGQIPPGLLTSNSLQFTYCPGNKFVDGGCKEITNSSDRKAIIGVTVGGVAIALIIICVGVFFGLRCYRRQANNQQNNRPSGRPIPLKEIATSDGSVKAFTLAALAAATNNFKKEIGRGGFGRVYHGTLPDGREVAVKVADKSNHQGNREFHNEVAVLSKLHHRNLTALVGYCQEKKKQILVYEYVRNGSLYDQLHGNPKPARPLDWRTRLNIALNAAQGLDYLHSNCTPSIIHRDVKSGNILLTGPDHPEVAKVADFGLSRTGPLQDKTHVSTLVRGTAGYFDTQQLNVKSDVFSFGVVLLELITGRIPIYPKLANRDEWNVCQYVRNILGGGGDIDQILDPAVRASHPNPEGLWITAEVALRSVEPKAVHRPTMAEVILELRAAIALEINNNTNAPRRGSIISAAPHTDMNINPRRAARNNNNNNFHQPSSMSSDLPISNVFYECETMPAPR